MNMYGGTLRFPMTALRPLIRHTLSHPQTAGRTEPSLILVHDEGIYLMSNGHPDLLADGTDRQSPEQGPNMVVYAEGYAPTDPDYYEMARAAVGGSDFAEYLPAAIFKHAMDRGAPYVDLVVTPWGISIMAEVPRRPRNPLEPKAPPSWRQGPGQAKMPRPPRITHRPTPLRPPRLPPPGV